MIKSIISVLLVLGIAASLSHAQDEYENCAYDYQVLKRALWDDHQNSFRLNTTFFPSHTHGPLYVTVTYNFPDNSSIDYIWSTATLYFTVHPHVLSYLSLFFSYMEDDRIVHLKLKLPHECSELAYNDTNDFLLVLTHRLQYYAENYEIQHAYIEAANHHESERSIVMFFSLMLGLPIAIIVLVWFGVRGAFPHLRVHTNNPEMYPTIAALYWIGQSLALFVVVVDIMALSKSSKLDHHQPLESYQRRCVLFVIFIEISGLLLSLSLGFVTVLSHSKKPIIKKVFECYYTLVFILFGVFEEIGRKEARVWLMLGSLSTPLIAVFSHAGFIIGGWLSYEERSIAILLLYLFIIVFLYWSLQYMYKFSTVVVNGIIRHQMTKNQLLCGNIKHKIRNFNFMKCRPQVNDDELGGIIHYEREMAENIHTTKHIGFDTVALFLMVPLVLFPYGIVFYFVAGLELTVLSSIDDALLHIFSLGEYAFYIAFFLVTYKVFTYSSSGSSPGLVSNSALHYWKFLNSSSLRGDGARYCLKRELNRLILTLRVFKEGEREDYRREVSKRKLNMAIVNDQFRFARSIQEHGIAENTTPQPGVAENTAPQRGIAENTTPQPGIAENTAPQPGIAENTAPQPGIAENTEPRHALLKRIKSVITFKNQKFSDDISDLESCISDQPTWPNNKEVLKKLCDCVSHFRMTLLIVLKLPPMYLNKDKANALTAALVYGKVHCLARDDQNLVNGGDNGASVMAQEGNAGNGVNAAEGGAGAMQMGHRNFDPISGRENNARYSLILSLIQEEL